MKVARIPQAAGSKKARLIQQGPSITILNHNDSDRALASWLFYKELTSVSNCIKWTTTTGYSPIRLSVAQSSEFLEYSNASKWDELTVDHLRALNAEYQLMQSNSLFSSPVFKGSSEARTQVGGLVTSVVSMENWDDASVDSLFETAVEQVILKM
jgi:ABC-type glycerol-3-phosphate transport system substrate-binding protein